MAESRIATFGRATLAAFAFLGGAISSAAAPAPADPSISPQASAWGAIAARPGGSHGYSFNQTSRATAERLARAQCERAAGVLNVPGAPGTRDACEVRAYFQRSCGALAIGNFGEWATAVAGNAAAAGKAAVALCDGLLPTEPCKLVVSVCSAP